MSVDEQADTELLVERNDDLLVLTLNRPAASNALSPTLVEALYAEITSAKDVRLCVIRGEGKHFCAGFDLSELESLSDGDLLWRFLRIEQMLQAVHHAPFPTIALAHSQMVGAGADLFAACWKRIAAPDVRLKMPGWNFELALGTRRLTRLIGSDEARDLLIDTKTLCAEQCLSSNLCTTIAEPEQWDQLVEDLLQRTRALPPKALEDMLSLTSHDSRDSDLAAIVHTAGKPGLKARIVAYRTKVIAAAKARKAVNL
jgi:enoyl-CoA hydratase/carnithine racemase